MPKQKTGKIRQSRQGVENVGEIKSKQHTSEKSHRMKKVSAILIKNNQIATMLSILPNQDKRKAPFCTWLHVNNEQST